MVDTIRPAYLSDVNVLAAAEALAVCLLLSDEHANQPVTISSCPHNTNTTVSDPALNNTLFGAFASGWQAIGLCGESFSSANIAIGSMPKYFCQAIEAW